MEPLPVYFFPLSGKNHGREYPLPLPGWLGEDPQKGNGQVCSCLQMSEPHPQGAGSRKAAVSVMGIGGEWVEFPKNPLKIPFSSTSILRGSRGELLAPGASNAPKSGARPCALGMLGAPLWWLRIPPLQGVPFGGSFLCPLPPHGRVPWGLPRSCIPAGSGFCAGMLPALPKARLLGSGAGCGVLPCTQA